MLAFSSVQLCDTEGLNYSPLRGQSFLNLGTRRRIFGWDMKLFSIILCRGYENFKSNSCGGTKLLCLRKSLMKSSIKG